MQMHPPSQKRGLETMTVTSLKIYMMVIKYSSAPKSWQPHIENNEKIHSDQTLPCHSNIMIFSIYLGDQALGEDEEDFEIAV